MADQESPKELNNAGRTFEHAPVHEQYEPFDQIPSYAIDRLSQAFETSAKRWELIVYPSLFAFIILAAYGFYLVFSLARDMHYLTISVDSNMTMLASNMQAVADNMGQLTSNVRSMTVQVESMAQNVNTLEPLLASIKQMDQSMQSITFAIHNIRSDTSNITNSVNQGIGRPMSFFNSFAPW
jgi:methyl-accepting chemotaxis protein